MNKRYTLHYDGDGETLKVLKETEFLDFSTLYSTYDQTSMGDCIQDWSQNADFVDTLNKLEDVAYQVLPQDITQSPARVVFDAARAGLWRINITPTAGTANGAGESAAVLGQSATATNVSANRGGTAHISSAGLNAQQGMSICPLTNKLWVADTSNHRVLRYSSSEAFLNRASAELVLGQLNFNLGLANRGGSVSHNTLNAPRGVHVSSDGTLWVADTSNHRVLRFDNSHLITQNGAPANGVLGQLGFTANASAATRIGMNGPSSIFTRDHRLWISDSSNNRILLFNHGFNEVNGAQADLVLGQANYTTVTANRGGSVGQNTLSDPREIFVDAQNNLWVADRGNNRVLRFTNAHLKSIGGNADIVLGQTSFTTNSAATTQIGLSAPTGVHVYGNSLWISDTSNNRVIRHNNYLAKTNGSAADKVLGQANFTTGTTGITQSTLNAPICVISLASTDSVWISDSTNNRIVRIDRAIEIPSSSNYDGVIGQETFTVNTANSGGVTGVTLSTPSDVLIDNQTGKVYVSDTSNNRVLRYSTLEAYTSPGALAEAVFGQPRWTTNFALVSASSLNGPTALCFDHRGNLWIADTGNHRVVRLSNPSTAQTGAQFDHVFGQPSLSTNLSSAVAAVGITSRSMNSPRGISCSSTGNLFVTDTGNNRVLRFNNIDSKQMGMPADAVLGQPGTTSNSAATTQSGLSAPQQCKVSPDGNFLWVADTSNNRIVLWTNASRLLTGSLQTGVYGQANFTTATTGTSTTAMTAPRGLFYDDPSNTLFATDNHRVFIYNNIYAKAFASAAADTVYGTGSTATTAVGYNTPLGLCLDEFGNIVVADSGNHRVQFIRNTHTTDITLGASSTSMVNIPHSATLNILVINESASARNFVVSNTLNMPNGDALSVYYTDASGDKTVAIAANSRRMISLFRIESEAHMFATPNLVNA